MRSDEWLSGRMEEIWMLLFSDFPKKNEVKVRFKGRWKNKFGHIKGLNDGSTEIVVNSYFRHHSIPEYIIDITLAHEIVHYVHGFHSPYPRRFKHPHKGGIVGKELKRRGFGGVIKMEKVWIKNEWPGVFLSVSSFLK